MATSMKRQVFLTTQRFMMPIRAPLVPLDQLRLITVWNGSNHLYRCTLPFKGGTNGITDFNEENYEFSL